MNLNLTDEKNYCTPNSLNPIPSLKLNPLKIYDYVCLKADNAVKGQVVKENNRNFEVQLYPKYKINKILQYVTFTNYLSKN